VCSGYSDENGVIFCKFQCFDYIVFNNPNYKVIDFDINFERTKVVITIEKKVMSYFYKIWVRGSSVTGVFSEAFIGRKASWTTQDILEKIGTF
jgi:hypothetical protein